MKRVAIRILNPVAFPIVKIYWFIRPRSFNGVKAVFYHEDHILLVWHSYGSPYWKLPGGQIKKDETPREAIRREVREELGFEPTEITAHGTVTHTTRLYHDNVTVFSCPLPKTQHLAKGVEIQDYKWFAITTLPRKDISDMTLKVIDRWNRG